LTSYHRSVRMNTIFWGLHLGPLNFGGNLDVLRRGNQDLNRVRHTGWVGFFSFLLFELTSFSFFFYTLPSGLCLLFSVSLLLSLISSRLFFLCFALVFRKIVLLASEVENLLGESRRFTVSEPRKPELGGPVTASRSLF